MPNILKVLKHVKILLKETWDWMTAMFSICKESSEFREIDANSPALEVTRGH